MFRENKNIDENDNLNFTNINICIYFEALIAVLYENRNEQKLFKEFHEN